MVMKNSWFFINGPPRICCPNFTNQLVECFFKLLCPCACNRPHWNLNWILWAAMIYIMWDLWNVLYVFSNILASIIFLPQNLNWATILSIAELYSWTFLKAWNHKCSIYHVQYGVLHPFDDQIYLSNLSKEL